MSVVLMPFVLFVFPTIIRPDMKQKSGAHPGFRKSAQPITNGGSGTLVVLALNQPAGMSVTAVITLPELGLLYNKRAAGLTSHCTLQHNAQEHQSTTCVDTKLVLNAHTHNIHT